MTAWDELTEAQRQHFTDIVARGGRIEVSPDVYDALMLRTVPVVHDKAFRPTLAGVELRMNRLLPEGTIMAHRPATTWIESPDGLHRERHWTDAQGNTHSQYEDDMYGKREK